MARDGLAAGTPLLAGSWVVSLRIAAADPIIGSWARVAEAGLPSGYLTLVSCDLFSANYREL